VGVLGELLRNSVWVCWGNCFAIQGEGGGFSLPPILGGIAFYPETKPI
jgi:hypothetical protein